MNKSKYLNDVLTAFESEDIISKQLKEWTFEMIGSRQFLQQHAYINKLNMQVVKNILSGVEDTIMIQFVDHEKWKPLIKDLFTITTFKQTIYQYIKPRIIKLSSIKSYFISYHEACLINILENFFYSITACQSADDYIIDIIEYSYKKITNYVNYIYSNKEGASEKRNIQNKNIDMNAWQKEINKINSGENKESDWEELIVKDLEIEFNIAMCCINILRYISDHWEQLPFPVRHHMMNVKDIPMLFVTLMELKPWQRKPAKDIIQIYENNAWVDMKNTANKIPKLEMQVWITVYNLFMNSDNNKKYEINNYRKDQLLRLRKYFSDSLYDWVPQMQNFYRSLEEIGLMSFNNTLTENPFIVEMVPVLSNFSEFKLSEETIKRIGNNIVKDFFEISPKELQKELEPINEIYSLDNMDYFMEDPKCAECGKDAASRCSRCKSEWYCSKECQVKRWKQHKEMCKALSDLYKDEKKEKEIENKKGAVNIHDIVKVNQVEEEIKETKHENQSKCLVQEVKPELIKVVKKEIKETIQTTEEKIIDELADQVQGTGLDELD